MRKTLYRYRFPKQLGKYQFMFDYIPGKWISSGTDDFIEAIHWADEKVESDLKGKGYNRKEVTLEEFAKDFFTEKDPQGFRKRDIKHGNIYSERYYYLKQMFLEQYIIPRFGRQTLSSITDVAIEDWFLDLHSVNHDKEFADDTKNKCLTTFRDVLREAQRQGYIKDNPAERVQSINAKNNPREPFTPEEMELLFPEDEDKLIKIWQNEFWVTFFLIARDTGFRPGAIAALQTTSYFPSLHGVYTRKSVTLERKVQDRIKTTGKGKDYHIGLLTSITEKFLQRRIRECLNNGEEFLFMIKGRNINVSTTNKHFKTCAGKVITLGERTQYCMRHSFETDLAGKVEDKVVAELMSHTQFNPTYDHRTPEKLLEELQPVRELLEKR